MVLWKVEEHTTKERRIKEQYSTYPGGKGYFLGETGYKKKSFQRTLEDEEAQIN